MRIGKKRFDKPYRGSRDRIESRALCLDNLRAGLNHVRIKDFEFFVDAFFFHSENVFAVIFYVVSADGAERPGSHASVAVFAENVRVNRGSVYLAVIRNELNQSVGIEKSAGTDNLIYFEVGAL